MAKINQIITQFPPAPNSATDTPQEFNVKANAFVDHQSGTYVGEVNNWATEANAVRDDINTIVATLPAGAIDDTVAGTTKTYSSQKIESIIGNIIESGTDYMKFDNGVLMQWGIKPPTNINVTTASSSVGFRNATAVTIAFPVPFIDNSAVVTVQTDNVAGGVPSVHDINATYFKMYFTSIVSLTSLQCQGRWQAIGRWK